MFQHAIRCDIAVVCTALTISLDLHASACKHSLAACLVMGPTAMILEAVFVTFNFTECSFSLL